MSADFIDVPNFVADPHGKSAFKVVDAEGSYLVTQSGRRYLDLTSGWNVANLGWRHPTIIDRVLHEMRTLPLTPAWCLHDSAIKFSETLSSLLTEDVSVLRAPTGAQAVEFAMRVARLATGRYPIVAVAECYHGSTLGSLLASGIDYLRTGAATPEVNNGDRIIPLPVPDDGNLDSVRRQIATQPPPAAVLVEPLFTNAGAIVGSTSYYAAIVETARKHGVLVIADEVGTGLGRIGHILGSSSVDLYPDITVFGKSLGGGVVPMAAVVMRRDLASQVRGLAFDSTFAGTPAGCAAGIAILELLAQSDLLARVRQVGTTALQKLRVALKGHPAVRDIRGAGLLIGIEFEAKNRTDQSRFAAAVVSSLHGRGLFCAHSRYTSALLLMPPLVIEEQEFLRALEVVVAIIDDVYRHSLKH